MLTSLMLIWLLASEVSSVSSSYGSCIGSKGQPVDWFIVYKMPRVNGGLSGHFRSGEGMMYMDDGHPEWEPLAESVIGQSQPIHRTLEQIYRPNSSSKEVVRLMYNDNSPLQNSSSSSKAHAKGALYSDRTSGFWLVHSVPSFPNVGTYRYPSSGTRFGQIFLCVTFPIDQLDLIGRQLKLINPQLYDMQASPSFETSAPELWSLIVGGGKSKKGRPKGANNNNSNNNAFRLVSRGRREFVSFAKSNRFGKDLYSELVAPGLTSSLLVETWLNGNGDFPSSCNSSYSVKNILSLNMEGMKFSDSQDHSKWAIADSKVTATQGIEECGGASNKESSRKNSVKSVKSPSGLKNKRDTCWICIGDINRQESQNKRGGGTLCFSDHNVWKEFRKLVASVENCKTKFDARE